MPRDPRTWQHWPDIYFPHSSKLPNGWTRLWDETAHRIVCYRVLDGMIQHNHKAPASALPLLDKQTRSDLELAAKKELLAGCYSVADLRVVPALRADRRKMLLNLHAANIKEGYPTVAPVEEPELLGTDAAPPYSVPALPALPEAAPPSPPSPTAVPHQQPLSGTMELAASPPSDDLPPVEYTPPLFAMSNSTLQHVIRPTVYIQLPWSIPHALTESGAYLSELCGCAPVSEYPALHVLASTGAVTANHPLPTGLAGPCAWDKASPRARAGHRTSPLVGHHSNRLQRCSGKVSGAIGVHHPLLTHHVGAHPRTQRYPH